MRLGFPVHQRSVQAGSFAREGREPICCPFLCSERAGKTLACVLVDIFARRALQRPRRVTRGHSRCSSACRIFTCTESDTLQP